MSTRQHTRRRFIKQTAAASLIGVPAVLRSGRAFAAKGKKSPVRKVNLGNKNQFAEVKQLLEAAYPKVNVSVVEVDGPTTLHADRGGMKVFWLFQGNGAALLPKGYRTQEGGAEPLPKTYKADKIDADFAETLGLLKREIATFSQKAQANVGAILKRWNGDTFTGDFAADLWSLEHLPRPWSTNEQAEAAVVGLFDVYRNAGYSTKQVDSYEPVMAGDQLIACGDETLKVHGKFRCFAIEQTDRKTSHISTARRLRYLVDTAGGCSFDFDPYRRLPLTWYMDRPGQQGDGANFVNSHVQFWRAKS